MWAATTGLARVEAVARARQWQYYRSLSSGLLAASTVKPHKGHGQASGAVRAAAATLECKDRQAKGGKLRQP